MTSGQTLNYTYDAAGNLINDGVHTYNYDAENRLKGVDEGTANPIYYAYDYANRRIKKLAAGVSTNYVWEGSQVIAEHNGTTGAVIFNYVNVGGKLIARMGSSIIKWYLSDRLSSRLVMDDAGAILGRQGHLPYGEEIGTSGEQEKHRFTSYDRETEIGLDYAINRWSSPAVGRFTSADPYRASGYKVDPQSWNRYSYTRNNPVNRVDRLGLEDDEPIRIGVTACKGGGYAEDWGGTCPTSSRDGSSDVLGEGSHDGKPDEEEGDGTGGEGGGDGDLPPDNPKGRIEDFWLEKDNCANAINAAGAKLGLGSIVALARSKAMKFVCSTSWKYRSCSNPDR